MIEDQDGELLEYTDAAENKSLEHGSSVGWVDQPKVPAQPRSWDSDSSGDYVVMANRSKKATELKLKVAIAQLSVKINGRATRVWIDSGTSISIFTVGELRSTLGAQNVKLESLTAEESEYREYGDNPLKMVGAMNVQLESNGWKTTARIQVIGGNRP